MAQALNESLDTILNNITDGFFLFDSQWCCIYMNDRAEQLLLKPKEYFLGKILREIVTDFGSNFENEGAVFEQKVYEAMLDKRSSTFESSFKDGLHWFVTHISPVPDGVAVYFHDITERKNMEIALRASEIKFRRLIEANVIGIIVYNLSGQILEANDAFLDMIGYTHEDLANGLLDWRHLTPTEYLIADEQHIQKLQEFGLFQPFEKVYLHKHGQHIPALVAGAMVDASSEICISYVLDLTSQKELERQKNIMVGIVSHELRTPLTAIDASIQMAQRYLSRIDRIVQNASADNKGVLQKMGKLLEQSRRQAHIQNRLIQDLLDGVRLSLERLDLEMRPCNLFDIVQATVNDIHFTAPQRQIELRPPTHSSIDVMADPDRIEQVIANYLTNAIKYTPSHEAIIAEISIFDGYAQVTIHDKGPGLSYEERQRVWDPFYQAQGITDRSGTGTNLGLGLYLCRTLIEYHDGRVGVDSPPGEGSSFWFTLPLLTETPS